MPKVNAKSISFLEDKYQESSKISSSTLICSLFTKLILRRFPKNEDHVTVNQRRTMQLLHDGLVCLGSHFSIWHTYGHLARPCDKLRMCKHIPQRICWASQIFSFCFPMVMQQKVALFFVCAYKEMKEKQKKKMKARPKHFVKLNTIAHANHCDINYLYYFSHAKNI